jgi:DNA-directed RNA polymerase, mitochondrial
VTTSEKPAALVESEKQTVENFNRREAQAKTYVASAEGQAVCETLLPYLAEFIRGEDAPSLPKGDLSFAIRERGLTPEEMALVALSSLLNGIVAGRGKKRKDIATAEMRIKLAMGRRLHDQLLMKKLLIQDEKAYKRVTKAKNKHLAVLRYREPFWSRDQYVKVGNWLLDCVLQALPIYFAREPDGFPCVTEAGKEFALQLRAELIYRDPYFLPTTEPPQDWTDWRCGGYWDNGTRISATFVRDSHPDTVKAISRAFRAGSMKEHVDGVNALQRVGWTINARMLPVVERFAGEIRKKVSEHLPGPGGVGKKVSESQVAKDVATARRLGPKTFYIPISCDKRGRVYGVPHFNFQREDHVRSLFRFAKGMPIGPIEPDGGNINWLAIHVANCSDGCDGAGGDFDGISKRPWGARIACIEKNKDRIVRIARDPEATVDLWRDADKPFSFVAACMELAGAWKTGSSYITRLPLCFDGSCSGIQHLAMMTRDEVTGRLVNLIPDEVPHDVYQNPITDRVKERLQTVPIPDWKKKPLSSDDAEAKADWWLRRGIDRKLIKRPAMTFAYSATLDGMQEHLDEIEDGGDTFFLAWHIMEACKEELERPYKAMKFIRALAMEDYRKGQILKWRTPTGFPWANRYYESKFETVNLELLGVRVRHRVAAGYEDELRERKIRDAAAPNFVHACDASHGMRVVNTAASKGISLAFVHDSFGCLAPHVHKVHLIIREQMAKLYAYHNVLRELRAAAGSSLDLPDMGTLDPWLVKKSTYAFA